MQLSSKFEIWNVKPRDYNLTSELFISGQSSRQKQLKTEEVFWFTVSKDLVITENSYWSSQFRECLRALLGSQ